MKILGFLVMLFVLVSCGDIKPEVEKVEEVKIVQEIKEVEKTEEVKIKEIKIEEIKVEEIKVEEIKVEEIKVEEIKVEEVKVEEVKEIKEVKTEEIDPFSDWSGDYYTEDNKLLQLLGPTKDGAVDIDLGYDDINCIGFGAVAYLEKSGVANFYDKGTSCQINLTFNPGVVELSSYKCGAYETTKCGGFSGTYKIK